jgi:hypothetical protein
MKKLILIASLMSVLGCNNSNEDGAELSDPNRVHPESESVPDSLTIVNDSVIVPVHEHHKDSAGVKSH